MTKPEHKRKSFSTPEPEEPTTQPQSNYVTPRGKKQKPSVIQGKGQPPSSADIRTPSTQRSGTSRAYSSRLSTTEQILTERHAEAHDHYERRLDKDDASILSLTEPLDRKLKGIAEEIIEMAALFMESYLRTVSANSRESADGMSDAIKPRPDSPMQL
ncbi:hypothetical protein GGI16_001775, partial [Coemansia sp. S142-1]